MATIESRPNTAGNNSYRVKIRLKGHPVQYASFSRLTDARRWAQNTESAIREGRHFKTNESKRHTLADAIARYKDEVMPRKAGSQSQSFQLNWWKDQLGAYTLADISPALLTQCREKLLREHVPSRSKKEVKPPTGLHKPATVVRYLAIISHVFSIAVKEWQWCEENPVKKISKPKEARGRDRFLDDKERAELLEKCKASDCTILYTIVVLALSTGMRRGELMQLHWKQIDFANECIRLEKTKNGDRRTIPLTGHALALLEDHGKVIRIDTSLVFPSAMGTTPLTIEKPWRKALKESGIVNFRFHDLRHSAASYLAMNGASLIEIAAVLGHRTLTMVKRYSHVGESHTQKVVASMNDKIFSGA